MSPWIAISISVFSLTLSGTTAYFNFFWVESSASAAVLGFREVAGDPGAFQLDVAVYNTGNRQMAVTGIDVRIGGASTPSTLAPRDDVESLPVVIEPKELGLFRLDVAVPAWDTVPESGKREADREVPIGLRVQAVSSVGAGMRSDLAEPVIVHVAESGGALASSGYVLSRSPEPFEVSEPEARPTDDERTPPPS